VRCCAQTAQACPTARVASNAAFQRLGWDETVSGRQTLN
jgi:hypothetical protein